MFKLFVKKYIQIIRIENFYLFLSLKIIFTVIYLLISSFSAPSNKYIHVTRNVSRVSVITSFLIKFLKQFLYSIKNNVYTTIIV